MPAAGRTAAGTVALDARRARRLKRGRAGPVGRASSGSDVTSDAWITTKIKSQMLATEDLKSGSIKVVTENGTVYLMGIVKHEQADIAVDIARQVSGVQKVVKIFQYR